ncbi:hypothetical protein KUV50_15350 [Membranicola marinus]|uniref:Uncharacterized protein n=1 Tax=Membranihabitans marinus TaxID=1227546 RepID=A0A953HPS1_9BACT|nr:glycosyl hydrolase family 28 protein [Membranihabitans marinus]MBY5959527.1 hypothetical protein [Membranihabitans marinus]
MMIRIFIFTIVLCFNWGLSVQGKDYKASLFGIKSDGITLNTGSIQTAIDFISQEGGGRLVFYVGRYLTGSIELKSNVTIHLEEGAVLVGVPSIYDYYSAGNFRSLLYSKDQANISVTGKGVIMGNGRSLIKSRNEQKKNGYLPSNSKDGLPGLVQFVNCDSVVLTGIILTESGGDVVSVHGSNHVNIAGLTIKNKGYSARGMTLSGNRHIALTNSYFETDGIELEFLSKNQDLRIDDTKNEFGEILKRP